MKKVIRLLADLAVALLVISASVALYRFGIMPLLENVFPLNDSQATALRRTGVMVSLFAAYWAVARYYERRVITEFAFKPVAISISALSGCALIGTTILLLFALHNYRLVSFRGFSVALPVIGAIVLGVVVEEVVFRGVIFRLLEQRAGTMKALVVQSLIFGGLHLLNEGTSAMTVISVTLLGAFWTVIFVCSRNLWVVIANHAAWNVTIFSSGVPLSGQEEWRSYAPFESSCHGPVWLTGGRFGPEDSVINVLIMACAFGWLVYWVRKQGSFITGSWDHVATRTGDGVGQDGTTM